MNAIRIEATFKNDGVLHLTNLPFREGDRVEAILQLVKSASDNQVATIREEEARAEAIRQFLEGARASKFCSTGPYPTRDELHERY
jgi:hypothetical protein